MTSGLDDVIAAETALSDVDGEGGRLIIRGRALEDLVRTSRFEDVTALLWDGFIEGLPKDLAGALGAARAEVFAEVSALDSALLDRTPMEAMRALIARLEDGDDATLALRLTAAPAVFTAAVIRAQAGLAPIEPDPDLGHAADVLRMMRGTPATEPETGALDAYLLTVADHGMNASTFAARVAASTRAGLTSAVLAGLSALKGPLHGGAPAPVIDMLDAIGEPDRAEAWLEGAVRSGERLMGFGHRIYRVRDPRADALKAVVVRLSSGASLRLGRLAFAEAVEQAALAVLQRCKPDRPLQTNVEFYTALLLEALALPPASFTCVFAMGRVAGWIAHAREQTMEGRLIRPRSRYVGETPKVAA